MRTLAFERWVVVCAASFAMLSSVALQLAFPNAHPQRLGSQESLRSQIRRGAAFTVQLAPDTCDKSTASLSCPSTYIGYYNPRSNAWVLTNKTSTPKEQIYTGTWKNAPDEPGHISLWGILGTFDEEGNIVIDGKVRGNIMSAWQNADR
jgi:hypothetical protein